MSALHDNLLVRKCTSHDRDWLSAHDIHVAGPEWVARCINLGEYYIAEMDGEPVGFLRYSLFWGDIPYMDMIRVNEDRRRQGVGTALLRQWEADMLACGARMLMTSSVEDELEPQAWHKSHGFQPAGRIHFCPVDEVPEIFLIRPLD